MKAFLSHSSKDKAFVEKVADHMGTAICEYDAYTFDYVLNTEAIRRALARCTLFVLFLSQNSSNSSFVTEETKTALSFRAAGKLKRVMIIALDQTSYTELPDWMRETNVASKLSSPQTVARKLEAELLILEAETDKPTAIYIPREKEEAALRQALKRPPGEAPVSVHAVGFTGLGRKTFLRRCLGDIFPRQIQSFVVIPLARFEGADEFYRRVYGHFIASSVTEKVRDFQAFAEANDRQRIDILSDLITMTMSNEEILVIDDQGGVYTDEGDYQPYISDLLTELRGANRPVLGVVQTRMMPQRYRELREFSFHISVKPFDDDKISELLSFNLKDAQIDYDGKDLQELTGLIDGNPINIRLAINSIKSYGLDSFLADPQLLIEWKRRRAEDFLNKIDFCKIEQDIIALLVDYRYAPFSVIRQTITAPLEHVTAALRKLEENCCIERRDRLYMISPPVHDAAGRDKRFKRSDGWKHEIATKIVDSLDGYKDDENVAVALIEIGVKASIRGKKSQRILSALLLPSYLVSLALEAYNEGKNGQAIEFCKKAFDLKNNMTLDAQIEVLRIWGLSAVRIRDESGVKSALDGLKSLSSMRAARRHASFIQGFQYRYKKKYDDAEREFLAAHKLASKNYSINRELASLYTHQKSFIEAEGYARAAYEIAPTNPYILDVLLECLLGKSHMGMKVNQEEIGALLQDLEKYGDVPGSSFYQARRAQDFLRSKNKSEALKAIDKAIERTPEHIPCYFLRGQIYLEMANAKQARKDLAIINTLLEKRGGFSEDDEGRLIEMEVGILCEEHSFRLALDKLNNSQFIPHRTAKRLAKELATAISFEPQFADVKSKEWAKRILGT